MFGFASLLYLQNINEIISMIQGCSEKIWQRESIFQSCRPQTSFAIISQRNLIFIWELLTNKTRIACSDLIWQIWLDWFAVKSGKERRLIQVVDDRHPSRPSVTLRSMDHRCGSHTSTTLLWPKEYYPACWFVVLTPLRVCDISISIITIPEQPQENYYERF